MDKKDTNKMPWKKLSKTASAKQLARIESKDFQFDIIKMAPNTTYEEHMHSDVEWIYILDGSFSDENGKYKAGDFISFPKGSFHSVNTGENGLEVIRCWSGKVFSTYSVSLKAVKSNEKS